MNVIAYDSSFILHLHVIGDLSESVIPLLA